MTPRKGPDLSLEAAHPWPVCGVDEAGRGPWAGPVRAPGPWRAPPPRARPGPGPGGLRRPLHFARPVKPLASAYRA